MARLNFCAGLGIFASVASVVLMIFLNIGQISSGQTVPRHIRMTTLDTTNFGIAVAAAGGQTSNLYGVGRRTGDNSGLRQTYSWGLWSYCEGPYESSTSQAYCSNTKFAQTYQPAQQLLADVPADQVDAIRNILPNTTFTSSSYLARFTRAAFYLFFVGAILAGISMLLGFGAHRFAFLFSAITGFLAFLCIAVGAVIWTVLLHRVRSAINGATVANGTSLGLHVTWGNGLWIAWGAAGAALLSVIPFFLACCFGRNSDDEDDYNKESY